MLIHWFTGQPGAGKTTLAKALKSHYRKQGQQAVLLDGDEWRRVMVNTDLSPEGRIKNIRCAQRMAKTLLDDGVWAICAFVSPFKSVRDELRLIAPVAEIYCWTTERRGREHYAYPNYEPPGPDALHLDTGRFGVTECIQQIVACWPLPSQKLI